MRLTDIVSGAGLSGYAIVAMLLFIAAFLAITIWLLLPARKAEFDRAGRLPLEDGVDSHRRDGGAR